MKAVIHTLVRFAWVWRDDLPVQEQSCQGLRQRRPMHHQRKGVPDLQTAPRRRHPSHQQLWRGLQLHWGLPGLQKHPNRHLKKWLQVALQLAGALRRQVDPR